MGVERTQAFCRKKWPQVDIKILLTPGRRHGFLLVPPSIRHLVPGEGTAWAGYVAVQLLSPQLKAKMLYSDREALDISRWNLQHVVA